MKCRCCNAEMEVYENVRDCVYGQMRYETSPFFMSVKDVQLWHCPICSHVQSDCVLPDDYYDSYSSYGGAAQYLAYKEIAKKRINKLKEIQPNASVLLDIGCGMGDFLETSKDFYKTVVGVEPSQNAEIPHSAEVQVLKGYFGSPEIDKELDSIIQNGADIIASFQVFEHLPDLQNICSSVFSFLRSGGVFLLNIPNGLTILNDSLYHQITHEHINYFTPKSVCTLLNQFGFEILEIEDDKSLIELNIYARKPCSILGFNKIRDMQKQELKNLIKGKKLSIWGAGAKAAKYFHLMDPDVKIYHLFDIDMKKNGLFVSNIKVPIEIPSEKPIKESDCILIFSSSYNESVINCLINDFNYKGRIIYFDEKNKIIFKDF